MAATQTLARARASSVAVSRASAELPQHVLGSSSLKGRGTAASPRGTLHAAFALSPLRRRLPVFAVAQTRSFNRFFAPELH